MSKIIFRTVMVVGDNPDELIKKYDLDTKVEPYVKLKRSDAEKARKMHLKFIEDILTSNKIILTDRQRDVYKNIYLDIQEMDETEYFEHTTMGCTYDDETGDALTTVNPNAFYQHAVNPQKRLDATNEESDFINPFILLPEEGEKEGEVISYTPQNEQEKVIKKNMKERMDYFADFSDKEAYGSHSCSFWCYGYLDENGYKELDYTISDKECVRTYYERFVEPISEDTTLSLYFVRAID